MTVDGQFTWVKMYINEELKNFAKALDYRIKIKNELKNVNMSIRLEIFIWIS